MTTRTTARAATIAAALLAFSLAPSPAQANATHDTHGTVLLTVVPVDPTIGDVTATTLWCNPNGGSHPDPEGACAQLTRANGHVRRIPPEPGPCTLEYAPVRLTALGLWGNHVRRYSKTHDNFCLGWRETGGTLFVR